jgi:catechol 2,3-dioxygenase-like lactoylglutathione lyase family enzyme
MSVTGIAVNCADVDRSVAFYEDHLGATLVERSRQGAVLEIDGGRIELVALPPGAQAWDIPPTDDHAEGFWHIGLRVDAVDPIADAVRTAGFGFFIEPVDNVLAGVRVAFFYDPDGVVIELVEGELVYTQVVDEDAARARRSLPRSGRARFDHVAFTTPTWHETKASWESVGFTIIGTLALEDDPRGALLYYLSDGSDLVIEVFTFADAVGPGRPADLARGFAGLIIPSPPQERAVLIQIGESPDGRTRLSDPRGLSVIAAR